MFINNTKIMSAHDHDTLKFNLAAKVCNATALKIVLDHIILNLNSMYDNW